MTVLSGKAHIVPLKKVRIQDSFWSEYERLVREVVVPYQWDALNDRVSGAEPSHAIQNFKIAAGLEQGQFNGMVFQDSDVAKWLEAVSYLLASKPDPELERIADEVIDIIAKAQQDDGYLNTYFTLKEPDKKWTNLTECHELYCAGHMIEAAVAYYDATGKSKLLDVVCRLADYMDTVFGREPGKIRGYDGHQEIELALVKLYHATKNGKYLKLSTYFLDERGSRPHFYDEEFEQRGRTNHWPVSFMVHNKAYSQAHIPVREQEQAVGHAVRLVYMCSGMADVAAETGDPALFEACRKLWNNIVGRQMYVTGGIGAMANKEAFTTDYDLPNDTVYAETCASIGLIFFAQRMLRLEPHSRFADVMERALYNTVVSGMSRDGKAFFYVNPLEVYPAACGKNHNYDHIKPVRQGWFSCACCPPNLARLLASLGQYIYSVNGSTVYTHLYIGGQAELELGGTTVMLEQETRMPWEGSVRFKITAAEETDFALALRIPDWCDEAQVTVNGEAVSLKNKIADGYAIIRQNWRTGDVIDLELTMNVARMKGHPFVRNTAGKTALQRGPFVYCLEEADNGANLHQILLPKEAELIVKYDPDLLGGLALITADAEREAEGGWGEELYKRQAVVTTEPEKITFIPYYAWANRGVGEMLVWVRERE